MGQRDFYFTLVSIDLLYKLKKSAQKSWAIPSSYWDAYVYMLYACEEQKQTYSRWKGF